MEEVKQQSVSNEPVLPQAITFDAILPPAMALRAEESGVKRATADPVTLLVLSVLAGAFVSFGAIFATTVSAGSIGVTAADSTWVSSATLPYGIVRLLIGLVFSVGLIMVIIAGAELFTGNSIIVMAWASGKVTTRALLLNWVLSFSGKFRRRDFDRGPDVLHDTIHVWQRHGRTGRIEHGECEGVTRFHPGADTRYYVQCTCVPGSMDVLQRSHEHRQGCHGCPSHRRIRRGWL